MYTYSIAAYYIQHDNNYTDIVFGILTASVCDAVHVQLLLLANLHTQLRQRRRWIYKYIHVACSLVQHNSVSYLHPHSEVTNELTIP